MVASMQAVQYFGYGGGALALKNVEVSMPTPREDEVLIKVEAASLNPIDWRIQEGILRPALPERLLSIINVVAPVPIPVVNCRFPYTPGIEVAGEVVDVGPNVHELKEGDKVIAMLSYLDGGGLAQYVVAPSHQTTLRPARSNAANYAGIPIAGVTALQILNSIGAKFDGTSKCQYNILVTGASGGVGLYLVQLARLAGMHVTATCGARNMDLLRKLGANEVVDYKTPEGQQLQSPSGKLYDYVINCVVGTQFNVLEANLTENGVVVEVTPTPPVMARYGLKKLMRSKKKLELFMLKHNKEDLELMVWLVKEGKVETIVDSAYPLRKAQEAWDRCVEGHATGKIIIQM